MGELENIYKLNKYFYMINGNNVSKYKNFFYYIWL